MGNLIKQKAFNEHMGILKKKPRHMAKGGMVRKYADGGVTITPGQSNMVTALSGPTQGAVNQNASNPNTGILGTIGGALGLNNNFQAGAANVQAGTNANQLNNAYTGAQTGLNNQNNIANTLIPQVGGAAANQNALAGQLYGMTQGTGPNPALAQLAQATGQNVANQGALMAGQRGAGANAGLIARQAAQQGAQTQQQAVGQAATLEAQQQIAAQQNLANLANQQIGQAAGAVGGQNSAQQNEQNLLQGANTAFNNTNAGMQSNINNVNAQTAAANSGIAGKVLGGVASGASSVLGALGFAEGGEVHDHIKMAEMNAASLMHHKKNYASGGVTIAPNPLLGNQTTGGPQVMMPQYTQPVGSAGPNIEATHITPGDNGLPDMSEGLGKLSDKIFSKKAGIASEDGSDIAGGYGDTSSNMSTSPGGELASDVFTQYAAGGGEIKGPHDSHVANFLAMSKGGEVPAKVSPGEIYLRPDQVKEVLHKGANPLKIGYKFPGKSKVKGDSTKNDTVPATLEDGGIVIKRSIVNKNDPDKASLFVHRAHMRTPK